MDKIITQDWTKSFGRTEQKIIHKSDRYTEMTFKVEEPGLASGNSLLISVPGISLSNVAIRPENTLMLFDEIENECVQSVFMLTGLADSSFSVANNKVTLEGNMHAFQYSPAYQAAHKIVTKDFQALHLDIDLGFFKSLVTSANTREFDRISNSLEKKKPFIAFSSLAFQHRMIEIINTIIDCPFNGLTRFMFIESKLMELLALQMEQITIDKSGKEPFNKEDIERLYALKNYIDKNYLETLSLATLCRMFRLNEFKLKKGFKQLFSTTVFGYILNLRMQKAQQLLSQKNMNISEIADHIGYKNVGSFSSEFKKRYGYSPSQTNMVEMKPTAYFSFAEAD